MNIGIGISLANYRPVPTVPLDPDAAIAALFESGEVGAWYDPSDSTTVFQDAAGTTPAGVGDPVGLILDKSQGLTLGSELVTNGTFDTDTSGWGAASGGLLVAANGQLSIITSAGDTSGGATQTILCESGKSYRVSWDIVSFTTDSYIIKYGASSNVNLYLNETKTSTGSDSFIIHSTSTDIRIQISGLNSLAKATDSEVIVDNISIRELPGNHATQTTSAARPVLQSSGGFYYLDNDQVDDRLTLTAPAINGTAVIATAEGTAAYGVNISAGAYALLTNSPSSTHTFQKDFYGAVLRDGSMNSSQITDVYTYFVSEKGAGLSGSDAYGSVTNFTNYWRAANWITSFPAIETGAATNFFAAWFGCSGLIAFPLIDTSAATSLYASWQGCTGLTSFPAINTSLVTNFFGSWYNCSNLSSFPLIDTSAATNLQNTWGRCSSLTTFPAGMFDSTACTNFINAFIDCALTQTSVDNILVSIDTAGTSNGTLNMTGGTSATPSATGLAAVANLQARGWTVTHN